MPISDADAPNASPHWVIEEYRELLTNWLHAHGFDEATADVWRKPKTPQERLRAAMLGVAYNIVGFIRRYGPTGFDDKPPAMDCIEYWLAHVDYDRISRDRFPHRC